jgi:mannosyltransferase
MTGLLLVLVLLLAAGLRFFRIDAQSFWNDEGNSARLAERTVDLILEGAKGDIHPPGYYLLLHYWRALFGQSEAALRGLSAVSSLVLVAFAFSVGRRLFEDEIAGLGAAVLVAINPFQVYYAQEARMYALLALWAMASSWAILVWIQDRHRGWPLIAYVLSATAGLYTHYAFPFVMLAQVLAVASWLWRARTRDDTAKWLFLWVSALAAVALLYLPWLPTAWGQVTSWAPPREAYDLLKALADVWRLLNFGQTIATEVVVGGLIAAAALVILSLLPPVDEEDNPGSRLSYRWRWGALALLVLVPAGLILGLGLFREAYQKFLLVAAAPLSVLAARGIISSWRIAGGIGVWGERDAVVGYRAVVLFLVVFFLFDTGRSLRNLYFEASYARADYRAIARHIEANRRPGDGVILNAPNQWEVFTYYYPDDDNVFPLARQRPFNPAANEVELEQITAEHQRLYAIFWGDAESDPERFIETWLEKNTYKAGETWYGDVRLAVYAVPTEVADTPSTALDVRFTPAGGIEDSGIYLDGYTLLKERIAAGDILQLALFWRVEHQIADRYKVFVHLYDDAGTLVAQTDSEPGATLHPTNTWLPGERIVDRYGVLIPMGTSAGAYTVAVGVYDIEDPDSRLRVTLDGAPVGYRLDLTEITVEE